MTEPDKTRHAEPEVERAQRLDGGQPAKRRGRRRSADGALWDIPLTVVQQNAVDCLILGKTDGETAAHVGVARQTINAWRNHHPRFIVELNQRRAAIWGAARDRMRAMTLKALHCIDAALDGKDAARLALELIKLAGLNVAHDAIGPTSVPQLLDAEIRRQVDEEFAARTPTLDQEGWERLRHEVFIEQAMKLARELSRGDEPCDACGVDRVDY